MENVIITISGGCAEIMEKPDFVAVIIRDYDVDGVDIAVLQKDEVGNEYQELIFPAENQTSTIIELPPVTEDDPITVTNYYKCDDCNTKWEDQWSCACDDECPVCGVPYSPYKSKDINDDDENESIEILSHNIFYFLNDGSKIEVGDCEHEHIVYMINQGYIEGDLSKAGTHDGEETVRGYWKIEKE